MNTTAILTIMRKEWAELYKNTLVLSTVLFLPLTFAALPLVILWATGDFDGAAEAVTSELPPQMMEMCQGLTGGACTQVFIASQFLFLFMMVPLIIPATIAPYSIVGEKTQRSLEPLLATPITTAELLAGKNLASVVPAVLATWLGFAVFAVGARLLITNDLAFAALLSTHWLLSVFVTGPLLAILSVNLAIIISSRSTDPRVAQQVASLVVFPVVFLFLGQIAGLFFISRVFVVLLSLALVVVDIGLTFVAVRLFEREAILTRWT